jgi:hypothetical protein
LALLPALHKRLSSCPETVKIVDPERTIHELVGCDAWGLALSNLTGKLFLTPEQCGIVEQAIQERSIIPPEIFEAEILGYKIFKNQKIPIPKIIALIINYNLLYLL